jgi:hypothetical protein
MKFIIFVIDSPSNPANKNEIIEIDAFNESLKKDGNWVTAAGIQGSKSAVLIDNRDGKEEVLSGSLFSAPEYYSGFWIIETKSEEEARKLALAGSRACNRRVELRPYIQ